MNAYDSFAWFYDRYWAASFQQWEMPALERLLLSELPPGAAILDICCGVGHLARELTGKGFSVTGVDSSAGMLAIARQNAPAAHFLLAPADTFTLPHRVDAALCTFDSINHILDGSALLASFRQVRQSLNPGGRFLFDFNTPDAYGEQWNATASTVEPDQSFRLSGYYDPQARLGHTKITMFREGEWTDVALCQRPWKVSEIRALVAEAGFAGCTHWQAGDLGLSGHYGLGRVYIQAWP